MLGDGRIRAGDIVEVIDGGDVELRRPLYARCLSVRDSIAQMALLTGGYRVTSTWCLPPFEFMLDAVTVDRSFQRRVVPEDEVPDEVWVAIALCALTGDEA